MEDTEQVLEDDAVEDDDSEIGSDPTDHVGTVGLDLLLLALLGTDDEKDGVFTKAGPVSASNRVPAWLSVSCLKTGHGKGVSGTESSTK